MRCQPDLGTATPPLPLSPKGPFRAQLHTVSRRMLFKTLCPQKRYHVYLVSPIMIPPIGKLSQNMDTRIPWMSFSWWMDTPRCVHVTECYSAIKRDELIEQQHRSMPNASCQPDLKGTPAVALFLYHLRKGETRGTEDWTVVARCWGVSFCAAMEQCSNYVVRWKKQCRTMCMIRWHLSKNMKIHISLLT